MYAVARLLLHKRQQRVVEPAVPKLKRRHFVQIFVPPLLQQRHHRVPLKPRRVKKPPRHLLRRRVRRRVACSAKRKQVMRKLPPHPQKKLLKHAVRIRKLYPAVVKKPFRADENQL